MRPRLKKKIHRNSMPALPCCVTLGKSLTLSELQFSETGGMMVGSRVSIKRVVCKAPSTESGLRGSYTQHHKKPGLELSLRHRSSGTERASGGNEETWALELTSQPPGYVSLDKSSNVSGLSFPSVNSRTWTQWLAQRSSWLILP